MQQFEEHKKGLRAYRNGFGIGAFTGIVLCIILGKPLLVLPVVLGLLFGSIAFEHKKLHDE